MFIKNKLNTEVIEFPFDEIANELEQHFRSLAHTVRLLKAYDKFLGFDPDENTEVKVAMFPWDYDLHLLSGSICTLADLTERSMMNLVQQVQCSTEFESALEKASKNTEEFIENETDFFQRFDKWNNNLKLQHEYIVTCLQHFCNAAGKEIGFDAANPTIKYINHSKKGQMSMRPFLTPPQITVNLKAKPSPFKNPFITTKCILHEATHLVHDQTAYHFAKGDLSKIYKKEALYWIIKGQTNDGYINMSTSPGVYKAQLSERLAFQIGDGAAKRLGTAYKLWKTEARPS